MNDKGIEWVAKLIMEDENCWSNLESLNLGNKEDVSEGGTTIKMLTKSNFATDEVVNTLLKLIFKSPNLKSLKLGDNMISKERLKEIEIALKLPPEGRLAKLKSESTFKENIAEIGSKEKIFSDLSIYFSEKK